MSDFETWWKTSKYTQVAYCENRQVALDAWNAAIALMRGQSWRPIETAPKDGGVFLVYLPNERKKVQTAWKTENGIMAIGGVFSFDMSAPTHWQPLPTPPKDTADEQ